MSSNTYHRFHLNDGSTAYLTLQEADALNDPVVSERIHEILKSYRNRRRVKDGFQAGWQENIQMYVGGRKEYDRELKKRGLTEIGKEYIPTEPDKVSPCANEEFAQAIVDEGVDLSDNERDAIISGDFFDD